ncbi:MAG: hypothetical protein ABIJ34_07575 [archaeon]
MNGKNLTLTDAIWKAMKYKIALTINTIMKKWSLSSSLISLLISDSTNSTRIGDRNIPKIPGKIDSRVTEKTLLYVEVYSKLSNRGINQAPNSKKVTPKKISILFI